jgi:hypothetical protein
MNTLFRPFCRLRHVAGLATITLLAVCLTGCSGCENSSDSEADTGTDVGSPSIQDTTSGSSQSDESDRTASGDASNGTDKKAIETDESATLTEKPPLEVDGLLTTDDITSVTGGKSFTSADLIGQAPGPTYNAIRFKPASANGGKQFGAGLQVWSFEDIKAVGEQFGSLRNQYLDVEPPPDDLETPGTDAFISSRGGITQLVIRLDKPPRILAVSCSPSLCSSADPLAELAGKAVERLRARQEESDTSDPNTSDSETNTTDEQSSSGDANAGTSDTEN